MSCKRNTIVRPCTGVDRMATHFVGGSPELGDITYVGTPRDVKDSGPVNSRLGFVTDSSVRTPIPPPF